MRGRQHNQPAIFHTIDLDERIPTNHPLRPNKAEVNRQLASMHDRLEATYSRTGWTSTPPEVLLKALLLQYPFSIPSRAPLVEQIVRDLLLRWFLTMNPTKDAFGATVFTHNCKRIKDHGMVGAFCDGVIKRAFDTSRISEALSSVDRIPDRAGYLLRCCQRSRRTKRRTVRQTAAASSRTTRRRISTVTGEATRLYRSKTNPEARLYHKGNGKEPDLLAWAT